MERNGTYFMYGEHYGNSTGFNTNTAPTLSCYVSPDMVNWTPYTFLVDAPVGSYFVPSVVFNPNTNMFVAWFNNYPNGCCDGICECTLCIVYFLTLYGAGTFGVAQSPNGTHFTIVSQNVTGVYPLVDGNALFVDDDNNGCD